MLLLLLLAPPYTTAAAPRLIGWPSFKGQRPARSPILLPHLNTSDNWSVFDGMFKRTIDARSVLIFTNVKVVNCVFNVLTFVKILASFR